MFLAACSVGTVNPVPSKPTGIASAIPLIPTSTITPVVTSKSPSQIQVKDERCLFDLPASENEGASIHCGRVSLPQDAQHPEGLWVELYFSVLRSRSSNPRSDALVYLRGGPGASSYFPFLEAYKAFTSFRAERDVVIFDQRGAGLSRPRLDCTPFERHLDYEAVRPGVEASLPAELHPVDRSTLVYPNCVSALTKQGVDLSFYNSKTIAKDVVDLVKALGYNEFDLYGISYGTRLAFEVMRLKPDGLRAVIADSSVSPNVLIEENLSTRQYEILQRVLDECLLDLKCNQRFPNLRARLKAVLRWLDEHPAALPEKGLAPLTGVDLLQFVLETASDGQKSRYIPLLIHEIEHREYRIYLKLRKGELPVQQISQSNQGLVENPKPKNFYENLEKTLQSASAENLDLLQNLLLQFMFKGAGKAELEQFVKKLPASGNTQNLISDLEQLNEAETLQVYLALMGSQTWAGIDVAEGMNLSVICHEEVPFNQYSRALKIPVEAGIPEKVVDPYLAQVKQVFTACALWPAGKSSAEDRKPYKTNIPLLIFQGLSDTTTPPSFGHMTSQFFPEAYYFEFPGLGHGVIRKDTDCPAKMVAEFLKNPEQRPDGRCIEKLQEPFVLY
jgi:pimeloyl-ACP methyl ester carboxylesterase